MTYRGYLFVAIATFVVLALGHEGYERFRLVSCWSGGYSQNAWMAYCASDRYGVYDVEAIWFEIEHEVASRIANAKVLTLSDSQLLNALSLGNASQWFAEHHYPLYMLSAPSQESGFGLRLIEKFNPKPAVVIFDATPYFTGRMGSAEHFNDSQAEYKSVEKLHEFQTFHATFCKKWPWICGRNFSYFRSRVDGHWIFPKSSSRFLIGANSIPNDENRFPTSVRPDEFVDGYPHYLQVATNFINKLEIPRECVVITAVPTEWPKAPIAKYLARSLGLTLIDPELPDMFTFDRAHLTPESALRWTKAFLSSLEPVLKRCGASSIPKNSLDLGATQANQLDGAAG